jgi:ABC-type transport system involved in cytochrome bd biosynthesis fused ATPase/permease subunit
MLMAAKLKSWNDRAMIVPALLLALVQDLYKEIAITQGGIMEKEVDIQEVLKNMRETIGVLAQENAVLKAQLTTNS